MAINFERLVSRGVARFLSQELDLSGLKISVNNLVKYTIYGGFAIFIAIASFIDLYLKFNIGISVLGGVVGAAILVVSIYAVLEFNIERRKSFMESILPDYIQLTAANMRSGISLDKAMISSARPEFKYFSEDIIVMDKQIYAGESMQNALIRLGQQYRSRQLQHMMRMLNESIRYGGSMNDLLKQIAKDLRNQAIIQKEISGQLFLYTIFIAFAVLIGAPSLYALTNKMINVTDTVWAGILKTSPSGLPSSGVAFIRPSPPKITTQQYYTFSIIAVLMITSLGALIVSVISSGSILRGIRFLPIFIIVGIAVFFIVSTVISSVFGSIGGGV
jgi:pilus assembly protein TadC